MAYIIKVDDKEFRIDLYRDGDNFRVYLNGKEKTVELVQQDNNQLTLIVDNKPFSIIVGSNEGIVVNDERYSVEIFDEQIGKLIKIGPERIHKKELAIKAPMPGLIVDVVVKEGDEVKTGQGLLIVEAMKMQNEMKTSRDGIIKKIVVKKGQTVNSGDTLIVIE
jgi:biotin carboxyl carrier protein